MENAAEEEGAEISEREKDPADEDVGERSGVPSAQALSEGRDMTGEGAEATSRGALWTAGKSLRSF